MPLGKTIKVYLDDGAVTGLRHAEIVNWTGQAILCPRTLTKQLECWPEAIKPGVYFLFGIDEKSGNDAVYIGEAENVNQRLIEHKLKKDFWTEVVIFTSKDENLTKSHVKYLESRLLEIANEASRLEILNIQGSQIPSLPRSDKDALEEYILNLRVLLATLGHHFLEPLLDKDSVKNGAAFQNIVEELEQPLFLMAKNYNATATRTNEGVVIHKNSYASMIEAPSIPKAFKKLRETLIDQGVLHKEDKGLCFTKNYIFKSPSQAAGVIAGYSISGPQNWKNLHGITLKELERS